MPAIFISHSSLDQRVADEIKASLARLGFERVFLDFDKDTGLGAGENWEQRLYEELSRCHAVVLVLTPNWHASKWCFVELAQARALGKVVLPIICAPVGDMIVLPAIQAIDLLDWNADGLGRLEQRLRAISNELARGFALPPDRSPYPGIHAFEAEDAAIYFGRDEETRAVIERLDARRSQGGARFVVVIGASGAGKSSLLKAGVLPQLGRRRSQWLVLPHMRPETAPVEALAKALAQQLGRPDDWRQWHRKLSEPGAVDHIGEVLKDLRVGDARGATILLPIDQFEEVFTVALPSERASFIRLIAAALDPARGLPLMAVATGRHDVLEGLLAANELAQRYETFFLSPMPLDRVARLVEGPAAVAALNVEKGLSERIARDMESPEALPLLAHTLQLLHQRHGGDKRLTIAEYLALGDAARGLNPIQNSVRLVADQAIAGLRPTAAELAALRDAFVPNLVRVRLDDGKRVRQAARLGELPRDSLPLVRALVEARLLTLRAAELTDGDARVEVAHEALFQAWPELDRWLKEEHAFLSDLERIKDAHAIWKETAPAQQPSALLQGLLLARARDWLEKYPTRFRGHDMQALGAFIRRSADAEDAARSRAAEQAARARRMVVTLAIAGQVALVISAAGLQLALFLTPLWLVLVLLLYGTFARNRWGIDFGKILRPPHCPRCERPMPRRRMPKTLEQALWGGATCANCGCVMDKWGRAV